ncbi:MAG: pilus assembly protein TadG-related protein [Filomicrobium sp.]
MFKRIVYCSSQFKDDTKGVVAIQFSLALIVITLIIGISIDFGRMIKLKGQLVHAVDSAALAAGSALMDQRLTDQEIERLAEKYLSANVETEFLDGTYTPPEVSVNRVERRILIKTVGKLDTSFAGLMGIHKVNMPIVSETRFDQRDIELGIALDVTGSMYGSKLAALKSAANNLIDVLLSDSGQTNKVRIALAPYAASVNAGNFANTVASGWTRRHTCVHERAGANRFTDAEPRGPDKLGRRWYMSCPSVTVEPLSSNKNRMKSAINRYRASGATAGHLGLAWAWYMISPEWASVFPPDARPAAYNGANTMKAVVLMTDGVFNTRYERRNGDSSSQARSLCEKMKAKGVIVYSVAFRAPRSAQSLLRECSSGSNYYYTTNNSHELEEAFQKIAKRLNSLRLSK